MRCKDARYLISLDLDNKLTISQSSCLEDHLRVCDKCKAYKISITNISQSLESDSDYISNISFDASEFQLRLHNSLINEQQKSSVRFPVLQNILSQIITSPDSIFSYCSLRSFSYVIGAVIAGILLLYVSLSAPRIPAKDFGNDHIAAFTTHEGKEGRVYADLRFHVSQSRDYSKEKLQ